LLLSLSHNSSSTQPSSQFRSFSMLTSSIINLMPLLLPTKLVVLAFFAVVVDGGQKLPSIRNGVVDKTTKARNLGEMPML